MHWGNQLKDGRKDPPRKSIENYRINEPTLGNDEPERHFRLASDNLCKCGGRCDDLRPPAVYPLVESARSARALDILLPEDASDIPTQRE